MQNAIRYEYDMPYSEYQPALQDLTNPHGRRKNLYALVVVGMIVFIMSVIFCVVWEAAVARSLELEKRGLEKRLGELDEQKRELSAKVTRLQMPEELVRMAIEGNIQFVAIDPRKAVRLEGEE